MLKSVETMNDILGSKYQIISSGNTDPVVIAKIPGEDLAPKNDQNNHIEEDKDQFENIKVVSEKTNDDYLFQLYVGSLTVVGLFVLFRMIQKSR